jgi:hypothetical protein
MKKRYFLPIIVAACSVLGFATTMIHATQAQPTRTSQTAFWLDPPDQSNKIAAHNSV